MDAIGEIFSKDWKRKAFKFVAEANRFVTGYELSRRFGVSFSTGYKFIHRLVQLGAFKYPIEGRNPREVRITTYGTEIYQRVTVLFDFDK